MKIKVITVFRDKYHGKYYNPGEVLTIEDESRVADLVSRNLAEVIEEEKESKVSEDKKDSILLFGREFEKKALVEALRAIGVKVTLNMKEETLLAKATELDEEATAKLKEALDIEE